MNNDVFRESLKYTLAISTFERIVCLHFVGVAGPYVAGAR